jgi:hypothetical protein
MDARQITIVQRGERLALPALGERNEILVGAGPIPRFWR